MEKDTHTRSPGESSVYSLSIVLDDPPAPAARDELGFDTCDAPARRLKIDSLVSRFEEMGVTRTEFGHQVVWRLHRRKRSAKRGCGQVRRSRTVELDMNC
jgi:hypothetical protein